LHDGLVVAQGIGDRRRVAEVLEVLAQVRAEQGDLESGARLLGCAERERGESGTLVPPAHQKRYEDTVQFVRNGLGAERFEALWDEGGRMEANELAG
jgi:hypothetical protein